MARFEELSESYWPIYKNPIAQKILRACCRLETACNLIEHKTDAPNCLYFSISTAFDELQDAVTKYYGDFPNIGIWNDRSKS
jgi:hypothetical protein